MGVFERVLMKVSASSLDDLEDYSQPRYLTPAATANPVTTMQRETAPYLKTVLQFLDIVRGKVDVPDKIEEHYAAMDVLSRDIRSYTASMFKSDPLYARAGLVASPIEEEDFTASLGETLYQVDRLPEIHS